MSKALTVKSFCFKLADSHGSLELKVGLASGSVGCVLLGACRRFYCIYGTTVNLAARMSQHSAPDLIALPAGTPSNVACGGVEGGGAGRGCVGKSLLNLVRQSERGRAWEAGLQFSVALRKDAVMLKGLGLTEVCDVAVRHDSSAISPLRSASLLPRSRSHDNMEGAAAPDDGCVGGGGVASWERAVSRQEISCLAGHNG